MGSEVEYYLCFEATLTSTRLSNPPPLSEHQDFLHDKIVECREKGWTFKQITGSFNENGYQTPRGKKFFDKQVLSILKKRRIREERLNALPKDRFEITL